MNHNTRLSVEDVKAMIQSTTYTRLPSGKAIVCEIVLETGWTCHGIASVIDLENNLRRRRHASRITLSSRS